MIVINDSVLYIRRDREPLACAISQSASPVRHRCKLVSDGRAQSNGVRTVYDAHSAQGATLSQLRAAGSEPSSFSVCGGDLRDSGGRPDGLVHRAVEHTFAPQYDIRSTPHTFRTS